MSRMRFSRIAALAVSAAVVLAAIAPATAMAATSIKLSGSTTLQPLAQSWATAYHKSHSSFNITVAGGGSGTGFKDAEAGRVDIGMSSRVKTSSDPSDLVMTAVARDAVALIVNPKNKVKNLTAAQVKSIYTGQITNWKQVGGANHTIVLMGRTGASGTYAFFKEQFLSGSKQSSRTRAYASNGMVRSAVSRDQYAIGYVSIAFIDSHVRGVSISGVTPTKAHALSGAYRYVRDLFFITKGTPSGNAKTFINYCLSSAGQKIAAKEYLPLH